jgi:hypothetical protein
MLLFSIHEGDQCYKIRREMLKSDEGTLLWKTLAPILQGKIFYTPMDDPVTTIIMNEVMHIIAVVAA